VNAARQVPQDSEYRGEEEAEATRGLEARLSEALPCRCPREKKEAIRPPRPEARSNTHPLSIPIESCRNRPCNGPDASMTTNHSSTRVPVCILTDSSDAGPRRFVQICNGGSVNLYQNTPCLQKGTIRHTRDEIYTKGNLSQAYTVVSPSGPL
jgi:hypothetical protein